VQLGNYFRKTKFGIIDDASFNGIDGILGPILLMNVISSGKDTPTAGYQHWPLDKFYI
jgi:hypothetical protein